MGERSLSSRRPNLPSRAPALPQETRPLTPRAAQDSGSLRVVKVGENGQLHSGKLYADSHGVPAPADSSRLANNHSLQTPPPPPRVRGIIQQDRGVARTAHEQQLDRAFQERGVPLVEAPAWVEDPGLVAMESDSLVAKRPDALMRQVGVERRLRSILSSAEHPDMKTRMMRNPESRALLVAAMREFALLKQREGIVNDRRALRTWEERLDQLEGEIQAQYESLNEAFQAKIDDPENNIARGESITLAGDDNEAQKWIIDEVGSGVAYLVPAEEFTSGGARSGSRNPHRRRMSMNSMTRYYEFERGRVLGNLDVFFGEEEEEEE